MKQASIIVASLVVGFLALAGATGMFSEPTPTTIELCRSDEELAKLPPDHMSQQRCAEPLPFGG